MATDQKTNTNIDNINKDDFDFDAPQFQDFSNTTNLNISEEYCQKYFDKKTDEIRRLSTESNELQQPKLANPINNDKPSNLLKPADFHKNPNSNSNNNNNNIRNNKKLGLTTEEMELIAINKKKEELIKIAELNRKNVLKMRESFYVFQPTRSIQLTIPISPALQTSIRAQQRVRSKSSNQSLNNNNIKINKENNKNTFKLSKTKRKIKRKRTSEYLSSEQQQLKDIQNYGQFKARKFNPKIFENNSQNMGILNNIKNNKHITTVKPFNFATEKRAQKHKKLQDT